MSVLADFLKKLKEIPRGLRATQNNMLTAEQFLEVAQAVPIDEPAPLGLITHETLLMIVNEKFAFFDASANRWWVTPKGARFAAPVPDANQ